MHFYPNKNFTENTIINNPNYNAKINKNIFEVITRKCKRSYSAEYAFKIISKNKKKINY